MMNPLKRMLEKRAAAIAAERVRENREREAFERECHEEANRVLHKAAEYVYYNRFIPLSGK